MNRPVLIGLAIAVVIGLYLLLSSIFVVNPREQAVVTRFGAIIDVKSQPGLYFKLPTTFVDNVQVIENRLLRHDISNLTVQVSGGKFYEVDAFLTYRIVNARLFRSAVQGGNLQIAQNLINTRFDSALRRVYGLREFNAALSEQRQQMMTEVKSLIDTRDIGIEIVDVRILRTDLTQQVSEQTYERMRAERLAEAALLRARGQEQAQSLRAIADRQSVEIVAAARRDAEVLRGEGEAERSAIFATAFNSDPEFFAFYRSMQSYRAALGATGTTMVLSPDSEFFSYFGGGGMPMPVAIPPAPQAAPAAPAAPAPTAPAPAAP